MADHMQPSVLPAFIQPMANPCTGCKISQFPLSKTNNLLCFHHSSTKCCRSWEHRRTEQDGSSCDQTWVLHIGIFEFDYIELTSIYCRFLTSRYIIDPSRIDYQRPKLSKSAYSVRITEDYRGVTRLGPVSAMLAAHEAFDSMQLRL